MRIPENPQWSTARPAGSAVEKVKVARSEVSSTETVAGTGGAPATVTSARSIESSAALQTSWWVDWWISMWMSAVPEKVPFSRSGARTRSYRSGLTLRGRRWGSAVVAGGSLFGIGERLAAGPIPGSVAAPFPAVRGRYPLVVLGTDLDQPSPDAHLDVVGIGSPLVDVLATAGDDEVAAAGLVRGSMSLVDLDRSEEIRSALGTVTEACGGSAANTMVGIAALGGSAGFVGKIADDHLGRVFTSGLRQAGVEYRPVLAPPPPSSGGAADGPGGSAATGPVGTGRCLVLVSRDGERTMATHLGAATALTPDDVPEELLARARIVYLEGYLWDLPPAKEAMRRAMGLAHDHDALVALSLSDPFCVDRHRREFLDLLIDQVDVLFGNEEEVCRLFGAPTLDDAEAAAGETGMLVAITLGERGSVVVVAEEAVAVPAAPVAQVVDTTGAGDLFAAGFLFGLTHREGPEACARLGALCAGEVISHLGARPLADLRSLLPAHSPVRSPETSPSPGPSPEPLPSPPDRPGL